MCALLQAVARTTLLAMVLVRGAFESDVVLCCAVQARVTSTASP